jgi:hypothetical protein
MNPLSKKKEETIITKVILNNSKYDLNEAVSILTAILKDV